MAFNFAVISTFVTTKILPALAAIGAALPGLLSTNEADVQAALAAVLKVVTDLQSDMTTLIADVKAAG